VTGAAGLAGAVVMGAQAARDTAHKSAAAKRWKGWICIGRHGKGEGQPL
jgi:hypothetical protein